MILQVLCDYYDILAKDEKSGIPLAGFCSAKVSYALNLSKDGKLKGIVSLLKQEGSKAFPRLMTVPEQVKRSSGISSNFLCDNSKYVFGVSKDKNSKDKNNPAELYEKHFQAFKDLHFEILKDVDDDGARTILKFLENWDIQKAEEILNNDDYLQGANFVFKLDTELRYIHERDRIKDAWFEYKNQNKEGEIGQCLITGKETQIALLHDNIKNVKGAQSSGAALVSFNIPSFVSYGKKQSYNAPVGVESAFKYTTVLNHMLRNESEQKIQIGDATTVFWAEFPSPKYNLLVNAGLNFNIKSDDKKTDAEKAQDDETEDKIRNCFKALNEGRNLSEVEPDIEDDAKFYILGLSPNNARISVRFFYRDTFGNFMKNLAQHHKDMELEGGRFPFIPPWIILDETTVKNSSKDKPAPLLSGRLMQAIITGCDYPDDLYLALLRRIRAKQDINHTRVSVIKAYLKRKKKEVSPVLDETNTNIAYRLGRLFALLERAQENALGDINATIKDRYFATASATPGTVFPTLMKLNIHHIAKLEEKGKWLEIEIGKVLNEVQAFPTYLNMEEQGLFILGYYHQRQSFFRKKEAKEELAAV